MARPGAPHKGHATGSAGRRRQASMRSRTAAASTGLATFFPVMSVSLEGDERLPFDAERVEPLGAAELRQIDDECGAHHLAARALDQLGCSFRRAARGDQVVDDEDALAVLYGIL